MAVMQPTQEIFLKIFKNTSYTFIYILLVFKGEWAPSCYQKKMIKFPKLAALQ